MVIPMFWVKFKILEKEIPSERIEFRHNKINHKIYLILARLVDPLVGQFPTLPHDQIKEFGSVRPCLSAPLYKSSCNNITLQGWK